MKKGFTLIELLAVIVILAIIALIATPVVLNIIDDSREQTKIISTENYIDAVEQAIVRENLKEEFSPIECTIEEKKVTCEGTELKVSVQGELPVNGIIKINKGSITTGTKLNFEEFEATIDEEGKTVINQQGLIPESISFAEDDWSTIAANVRRGNTSAYKVGDTKEIALTGFKNKETDSNGLYTIRIANNSTPTECNKKGFSQTACGFVIEFEDIITKHVINETPSNVGGYPSSLMYSYIQKDIYNALPKGLKNVIILTDVVSSHEPSRTENYKTEDKLYLLSTKEVWGENNVMSDDDSSYKETRQLDYYYNLGVSINSFTGAIKKLDGTATNWWLRSASADAYPADFFVFDTGEWGNCHPAFELGLTVAFRIG